MLYLLYKALSRMAAAILFAAALAGCATQSDMLTLNERLIDVERRSMELQQRNQALMRENDQIRARVETYTHSSREKEMDLRDQSAGVYASVERFKEDISRLNGRIEESQHEYQAGLRRLEDRLGRIEGYLNTGGPSGGSPGLPPGVSGGPSPADPYPAGPSSAGPAAGGQTFQPDAGADVPLRYAPDDDEPSLRVRTGAGGPVTEDDLYAMAKTAFDTSDYDQARQGFEELIRKYPRSPHADNAQFWIGEIHYRHRRYEEAILAYQTVIERYPQGNKVRASLLKQGLAFANLGDRDSARRILQDLTRRYPGTNEAQLANGALGKL